MRYERREEGKKRTWFNGTDEGKEGRIAEEVLGEGGREGETLRKGENAKGVRGKG